MVFVMRAIERRVWIEVAPAADGSFEVCVACEHELLLSQLDEGKT